MRILIAGDIISTPKNEDLLSKSNLKELLGQDILKVWFDADYRIANLEAPITDSSDKEKKYGLNAKCSPRIMPGIRKLGFTILGCANNHILDYGNDGLNQTIKLLDESGITIGGICKNSTERNQYRVIADGEQKVGVYFCCDKEFSCASEVNAGAIQFDHYDTMATIKLMKQNVDVVLVVFHTGIEFFPYPSPEMKRDCEAMVDAGADFVICQHNHCISCEQRYKGSTIVYGQGHFISNLSDRDITKDELLVQLDVVERRIKEVVYIPIQATEQHTIRFPKKEERCRITKDFQVRSQELETGEYLRKYAEMINTVKKGYLVALRGGRLWDRMLLKFLPGYMEHLYNEEQRLQLYNYTNSHIHAEIVRTIFSDWRKK